MCHQCSECVKLLFVKLLDLPFVKMAIEIMMVPEPDRHFPFLYLPMTLGHMVDAF